MAYGIDTIQGAARVINRDIAQFVAWQRRTRVRTMAP